MGDEDVYAKCNHYNYCNIAWKQGEALIEPIHPLTELLIKKWKHGSVVTSVSYIIVGWREGVGGGEQGRGEH